MFSERVYRGRTGGLYFVAIGEILDMHNAVADRRETIPRWSLIPQDTKSAACRFDSFHILREIVHSLRDGFQFLAFESQSSMTRLPGASGAIMNRLSAVSRPISEPRGSIEGVGARVSNNLLDQQKKEGIAARLSVRRQGNRSDLINRLLMQKGPFVWSG